MKNPSLIVIADDFTGALDTGVQFSNQGISTYVACDFSRMTIRDIAGCDVLVIDTQSRHFSATAAAESVRKAAAIAIKLSIPYIYKKTDSTLRGNIGAELDAVIKSFAGEPVYFVPAYPEMNRTTRNGIQYIEGKVLSETVFSSDILNPIKTGVVRDLLSEQTDLHIVNVTVSQLSDIESSTEKNTIYIFDAETIKDMALIARKFKAMVDISLFAGCAGFARFLPDIIGLTGSGHKLAGENPVDSRWTEKKLVNPCFTRKGLARKGLARKGLAGKGLAGKGLGGKNPVGRGLNGVQTSKTQLAEKRPGGKTLIICGSVNQMSLEQTNTAIESGIPGITLEPEDVLNDTVRPSVFRAAVDQLNRNEVLLLKTCTSVNQVQMYKEYGTSRNIEDISLQIAGNTGKVVMNLMVEVDIDNLIVFGGDTLRGIIASLGISGMKPEYEVLNGIPLSSITVAGRTVNLVTKAGGYGNRQTLVDLVGMTGWMPSS